MNNPPTFTVAPTSMTGQSLFQWTVEGARFPMSIQMPTDVAEHLAALAARNVALTAALQRMVAYTEGFTQCSASRPSAPSEAKALLRE